MVKKNVSALLLIFLLFVFSADTFAAVACVDHRETGAGGGLSGSNTADLAPQRERAPFGQEDGARADMDDTVQHGPAGRKEDGFMSFFDRIGFFPDIPENIGTANVIKRAYQLTKLSYTAAAEIPHFGATLIERESGHTGVPYSSVRPENLYVPQCVSLDSFMTALRNPNSYLYTRRMDIPGYSGHCYFGSVCSSFAAWCYGIDDTLPTTTCFAGYPGFHKLPEDQQDWEHIRLGDMLNLSDGHIVVVTGIIRNRLRKVIFVEISEETNRGAATAISAFYPREKITRMVSAGYRIYRYEKIADVPYTASPWVRADASEEGEPIYNDVIIPRRGDKANWHEGEDVVVDILKPEGFTGYMLREKYSETITTGPILGNVLSFSGLSCGSYRLKLMGTEHSDWTYFDVKRTQGTKYETLEDRKVKVTPYIDHGEIASVVFCCNNPKRGSDNLAVRSFHIFTDEEKEAGYAIVDAPPANERYGVNDVWYMRCLYKTGDFGLYSGQLTLVDVSLCGATAIEEAYQKSPFIEEYSPAD